MVELGEILQKYGTAYREKVRSPLNVHKAMTAIEHCRTSAMGGHVEKCDDCGLIKISYNSCRNRHCPKCQRHSKEKWLEARLEDLLPIQYYHAVFTMPSELRKLCLYNKEVIYSLLFKASAETIKELSQDKKYIGAEVGFISVLHTWGQDLSYHPHIHMIITGGGLSEGNGKWVNGKKKFFVPVRVMSKVFKGKFLYYLRGLFYKDKLVLPDTKKSFYKTIECIQEKEWIVYCKKPFGNAGRVMAYLGRYTHRVAISNHRIKQLHNGQVTFEYKSYKENNKKKFMTLEVNEFIRRFLLHIFPHRFMKIRHYGLLSNRSKQTKLNSIKKYFGIKPKKNNHGSEKKEDTIRKCPSCPNGKMIKLYELKSRGSPIEVIKRVI